MRDKKEKRINRLKRMHIWPAFLGLLMITFIFIALIIFVCVLLLYNTAGQKFLHNYDFSNQIVSNYIREIDTAKAEGTKSEEVYEKMLSYLNISSDIEAIAVISSEGEELWSSNEEYPDVNYVMANVNMENQSVRVMIHEDSYGLFRNTEGGYELSAAFLNRIDYMKLFKTITFDTFTSRDSILSVKLWYEIEANEASVYILNQIHLYNSDLYPLLAFIAMVLFMAVVTIIYYLCTTISLFRNQAKISKVIFMDLVTGGYNWLYFTRKGNRLLKKNRNGKLNYAVVEFSINKYRSFCTCFGYSQGEELIERIYSNLREQIKKKELIAHNDGANFALLLRYENKEELFARVNAMDEKLSLLAPNIKLKFNKGICIVDAQEKNIEILYNNASEAKALLDPDADVRVAFFDEEMKKNQLWERKVEDDMERALTNKEFKLYLQPKYSAQEEKLAGAEALVRWIHPTEGFVSPNRFIPILEKNGFILKLDDYMIEEVARQQAEWIRNGNCIVPISVNVSRAHFTREDLTEHICSIVDKYQVPHNLIELELTESAFFDDKNVIIETVRKLRNCGFYVSMDDFGAGYSSLNSLKELHIDVLKIDAEFFRNMEDMDRGMLIVSEVINLAKKLNMKIVAEGIESKEQVAFLADQDCDLIQGYYFAKPMPVSEFEQKYHY